LTTIRSIVCLCEIIVLFVLAVTYRAEPKLVFAQGTQETTKETQDQKKPSPGFEDDDQSAMCLSATRQAKVVASILETYSRRLGACATSNPNFRNDCSVEFRGIVQSYNQYQLAVSSRRNYCK
jgi:hypothetical protein